MIKLKPQSPIFWLSFPIPPLILLGYLLYMTLTASGLHLMLATYTAVISGALFITLHEMYLPFRNEWRPQFGEVRADALFLVTVQVALPYLLSFALVLTIASAFEKGGLTISNLWPHGLPIIMQTISDAGARRLSEVLAAPCLSPVCLYVAVACSTSFTSTASTG